MDSGALEEAWCIVRERLDRMTAIRFIMKS